MVSKKFLISVMAAVAIVCLPACWPSKKKGGSEASGQLHVLNVLDPEQYNECHIPGSLNVPYDKVAEYAQSLDKNAEVVVYCSNYQCSASSQVAKQLRELGFENVAVYEGGTAEWYQRGNQVEGAVAQGAPASEYLTKVVERPADVNAEVAVISADALKEKLVAAGVLKLEEAPVAAAPAA